VAPVAFTQRAAHGVHRGGDRREDAQREEAILGELRARGPGVAPVEAAQHVLAQHGEVQQRDDDGHVRAVPVARRGGGALLAVGGAELGGVGRAPAAEQEEVVAEGRVLVQAHEREERVEDLVVDLDPAVPVGRRRERAVEQAEEEEHEHAAGDADAEQPQEQRHVHGVLYPLLACLADGGPVHVAAVARLPAPEGGELLLDAAVRSLLRLVVEEALGELRRGRPGSVAEEAHGAAMASGGWTWSIVAAGHSHIASATGTAGSFFLAFCRGPALMRHERGTVNPCVRVDPAALAMVNLGFCEYYSSAGRRSACHSGLGI
jgi:hypothetical protein